MAATNAGISWGVVLKVRVHRHNVGAASVTHAGIGGGRLAAVELELDAADASILLHELFDDGPASILGTIIDEEDFRGDAGRVYHIADRLVQQGQVLFLIVDRDADG
jgi:hypothetical protein